MRGIYWILSGGGLLLLGWYLVIKPFEFEATFKTGTLPGDIIQTIRLWDRTLDKSTILEVDSTYRLKQRLTLGGRTYEYNWRFTTSSDTVTNVNVEITELSNQVVNKILVPFLEQPIEKDAKDILKQFYDILKTHLKITNVRIEGEAELTTKFCACTSVDVDQIDKARGMMRDYPLLSALVSEHNLKSNGLPIVQILNWNHSKGKLKFNFCFPIQKTDILPDVTDISYREIKGQKVLKAVYNGNYITSDRAWYSLIDYAKANGYQINGLPIEYFYDNPNLGVNEREWKAEVFLPVK